MRLSATLLLIAVLAVTTGRACAETPTGSALPPGARVGVMLNLEPQASHLYIGATAFQNNLTRHDPAWNYPGWIEQTLVTRLKERGLEPVMLPVPPALADRRGRTLSDSFSGYRDRIDKRAFEPLQQAVQGQSLAALIVVETFSATAVRFPGGYSELPGFLRGYGLLTRSGWPGKPLAFAFAFVQTAAFTTEPLQLIGASVSGDTAEALTGFEFPDPPSAMPVERFEVSRPVLERIASRRIDEVLALLPAPPALPTSEEPGTTATR